MPDFKNRKATVLYMAFNNVLHDLQHAGIITGDNVMGLVGRLLMDADDLLVKGSVDVRGHEGEKLTLESEKAHMVDDMLANLETEMEAARLAVAKLEAAQPKEAVKVEVPAEFAEFKDKPGYFNPPTAGKAN